MVICGVIAFMGFFIAEQTHNVIGAIIGVIALGICFGAVKRIQHMKIEKICIKNYGKNIRNLVLLLSCRTL